jgi:hypothetical protein
MKSFATNCGAIAMKDYALNGRHKQKDAYDIYCVRNYPDGIDALAEACRPLLEKTESGLQGLRYIAEKFISTTNCRKLVI